MCWRKQKSKGQKISAIICGLHVNTRVKNFQIINQGARQLLICWIAASLGQGMMPTKMQHQTRSGQPLIKFPLSSATRKLFSLVDMQSPVAALDQMKAGTNERRKLNVS